MIEREIVVVGGHESREGARAVREVVRLLLARGAPVAAWYVVKSRRALCKRIKRFVKEGNKLVVVCGGDGAQTAACAYLAHSDCVLGVIPAGTGNSFAQTLHVPHDSIENAVEVIINGRCEKIDLGRANKRYFANFATIGLTAEVGAHTPRFLKRIFGAFAYAITAIRPLITERAFKAKLQTPKRSLKLKTFQIVVASGRYFGDHPLTSQAEPTDGKLTLFTTTGLSHAQLLRMYLSVARGEQTLLPDAVYFNTKRVRIKTRRKLLVSIDGNFGGFTPVTFSIARKALRVMVPAMPKK